MDTATGKLVDTREKSGDVDLSESETGSEQDVTGRLVAYKNSYGETTSKKSDCQGGPKAERTEWSHNLHVSPATIHRTKAVFSIVKKIYGREHNDPMDDLDVNMESNHFKDMNRIDGMPTEFEWKISQES